MLFKKYSQKAVGKAFGTHTPIDIGIGIKVAIISVQTCLNRGNIQNAVAIRGGEEHATKVRSTKQSTFPLPHQRASEGNS